MSKLSLKSNKNEDSPEKKLPLKERLKARKESALENQFNQDVPLIILPPMIKPKKHILESDFEILDYLNIEEVDKNNLQEENRGQAVLMGKISKILGNRYKVMKYLELQLSMVKDRIGEHITKFPERWGLKEGEKVSEATISRVINRSPQYQAKYVEYENSKGDFKEWEGIFESGKQRSTSIGRALKEAELEYNEE